MSALGAPIALAASFRWLAARPQATGRVKRHDNQLHPARVLEVRIESPPARSLRTFGPAHFAVDPAHRLNCAITDIDLAERRRDGFDPFGASVVVMAVHSPLMIAHQWACLDHASNGRAILGVGLGREHHYRQFEVPEEGRVTRFREELAGKITITGK